MLVSHRSFFLNKLIFRDFRSRGDYLNKLVHILESVNGSSPFSDWDEADCTIREYRARFTILKLEHFEISK